MRKAPDVSETQTGNVPAPAANVFGEYGAAISCACAVILFLVIASIDKLTGFDLRLSILYLVPVAIFTWTLGAAAGAAMSIASTTVWLALFWKSNSYSSWFYLVWDGGVSLLTLLLFVFLLARQRDELRAHDRRFVKILDHLDAPVYVADTANRKILYVNRRFRDLYALASYDDVAQRPAKETSIAWSEGRRALLRILA